MISSGRWTYSFILYFTFKLTTYNIEIICKALWKGAVSPKRGSARAPRVKNSHLEKGRTPKEGVAQYYSVGARTGPRLLAV